MEIVRECIGAKTGKSEREKLTLYINAYMWNPKTEMWYRCNYVQSINRDTDVQNKYMDTQWV